MRALNPGRCRCVAIGLAATILILVGTSSNHRYAHESRLKLSWSLSKDRSSEAAIEKKGVVNDQQFKFQDMSTASDASFQMTTAETATPVMPQSQGQGEEGRNPSSLLKAASWTLQRATDLAHHLWNFEETRPTVKSVNYLIVLAVARPDDAKGLVRSCLDLSKNLTRRITKPLRFLRTRLFGPSELERRRRMYLQGGEEEEEEGGEENEYGDCEDQQGDEASGALSMSGGDLVGEIESFESLVKEEEDRQKEMLTSIHDIINRTQAFQFYDSAKATSDEKLNEARALAQWAEEEKFYISGESEFDTATAPTPRKKEVLDGGRASKKTEDSVNDSGQRSGSQSPSMMRGIILTRREEMRQRLQTIMLQIQHVWQNCSEKIAMYLDWDVMTRRNIALSGSASQAAASSAAEEDEEEGEREEDEEGIQEEGDGQGGEIFGGEDEHSFDVKEEALIRAQQSSSPRRFLHDQYRPHDARVRAFSPLPRPSAPPQPPQPGSAANPPPPPPPPSSTTVEWARRLVEVEAEKAKQDLIVETEGMLSKVRQNADTLAEEHNRMFDEFMSKALGFQRYAENAVRALDTRLQSIEKLEKATMDKMDSVDRRINDERSARQLFLAENAEAQKRAQSERARQIEVLYNHRRHSEAILAKMKGIQDNITSTTTSFVESLRQPSLSPHHSVQQQQQQQQQQQTTIRAYPQSSSIRSPIVAMGRGVRSPGMVMSAAPAPPPNAEYAERTRQHNRYKKQEQQSQRPLRHSSLLSWTGIAAPEDEEEDSSRSNVARPHHSSSRARDKSVVFSACPSPAWE